MPDDQETYEYTEEFQQRIAALVLRDPTFTREYGDVVDPKYFDYPYLTSIVRIGKSIWDKHAEVPSRALLVEEVADFCTRYRISPDESQALTDRVRDIYAIDLIDSESIKERVLRFGRRQALKSGVMEIVDMINTDSGYEKAVDIVENALTVGYDVSNLGLNFFQCVADIPKLARRDNRGFVHKVRTNLSIFDSRTQGGPGRGEIWVILGLSGIGKSQYLVNMGAAALNQGVPTVHITIGDLDAEDVGLRYAAKMTQCAMSEVLRESPEFVRRAKKLAQYTDRYLRIRYYDPATIGPSHIKAYLTKLLTIDGVKPGMIIIDYPDEFKPYTDDMYQNMGRIYSELKAIAGQFNSVMWVASQVHRWFPRHKNDVLTRQNISDSAKKVHKADGICSINQTWEEADAGKARLWVDKVRRGASFFLVPLDVDWKMCHLSQGTTVDD